MLTVRERFLLLVLIELGEFLSKDRASELVVHHRKEEIRSIVGGGAGSFNSAFSRLVSLGVLSSIEHPSSKRRRSLRLNTRALVELQLEFGDPMKDKKWQEPPAILLRKPINLLEGDAD